MSQHMVIFQNPDGDPGYNQFESIEEAVSFVETIRNDQGIDSIRIFELSEVKFDLKPYYKVELQALSAGSPSSSASSPSASSGTPSSSPLSSSAPSAPAAPSAPSTPASPIGSDPAPAPAPSPAPSAPAPAPAPAPSSDTTSTSPFAAPSEPTPTYPAPSSAPTPPADQPQDDSQPTRRGLFGR